MSHLQAYGVFLTEAYTQRKDDSNISRWDFVFNMTYTLGLYRHGKANRMGKTRLNVLLSSR